MISGVTIVLYAPTASGVRALREAMPGLAFETQRPLADAIAWSRAGEVALVGPAIGAPAAVLACDPFLSSAECTRLIVFGVCGALRFSGAELRIGDVVVPNACLREDGTSAVYGAPEKFSVPAWELAVPGRIVRACPVWTTDSPLLEDRTKAEIFYTRGARVVEMELSALAWLASRRGVVLNACFVVSDLLGDETRREFRSAAVRGSLEETARAIAGFFPALSGPNR